MKTSALSIILCLTFITSMLSTPVNAAGLAYACGTSGSYTVTDGVLTGHSSCVGDLNIDSSVTEIANDAFAGNTALDAVTIPGSVITIGEGAFAGAGATSLTLGEGIIEIKFNAFGGLNQFRENEIDISIPDSVTTLGNGTFQQVVIGKLVVGDSLVDIPQGAFYNNFGGGVRSIDFGSSVANIGASAFMGFRGDLLYFPESLRTIQDGAFSDGVFATTVLLPPLLTSIASNAFAISPTTTLYCGSNPDIENFAFPEPNNAKVCGNLVRFDRNGGDDNQQAQQVSLNSANLTTLNWTKAGMAFSHWTSNQNGTGTRYSEGALFTFAERFATLYAQWRAMPRVVFDANTGSGVMGDQSSPAAANLEPNLYAKCGFDFGGWSTNQNGGPTTFQDQASFPFFDAETRLYAQWNTRNPNINRVRRDVTWNSMNGNAESNALSNGTVMTMVVNPVSGELYAGGTFTDVAGIAEADYIAKWDGTSWSALGSNADANGALAQDDEQAQGAYGVFDLAFDSLGNLYVTGNFTISSVASHFAKWDGVGWRAVGTGLEFNDSGRAIAIDSRNHVYLGGHFTDVAGVGEVDYLAKWDGTEWLGVGSSGLDSTVRSIDIGLGDNVYIGTFASNIGAIPEADYIAKWNGSVWSALGGTLAGNGQLKGMPRNITVDSRSGVDIVYVGGLRSEIRDLNGDDSQLGYFVKWDGTRWGRALPDAFISDDYVTDVALVPGGGLIIGGWFDETDNEYDDHQNTFHRSLVYFNGTNTFGLGSDCDDPSLNGNIDSVIFDNDGQLIVGGAFTRASGNSSAGRIAISNIRFTEASTPTQGTFQSPMFTSKSAVLVSTKGQTLKLKGLNLGEISAIRAGGKELKILSKSANEILIDVPRSAKGYLDVEVVSSSGKVTLQAFLKAVKPYAFKRTQKITQFAGSLPTQASFAALKKMYLKSPSANLLTCISRVGKNASASQVVKAKAIAMATCQRVIKYSKFIKSADVRVRRSGKADARPVLAVTFDRTLSGSL